MASTSDKLAQQLWSDCVRQNASRDQETMNRWDLADKIADLARDKLGDYLKSTGRLLYSSAKTIDKGDIYFMGVNPAGVSDDPTYSLKNDLERLSIKTDNAYIDEVWKRSQREYEKGKHPLQKRTTCLLHKLTGGHAESVCATNLVFFATENASDIQKECIDLCWDIHESLLAIVRPKIIISSGTSYNTPYYYLKSRFCKEEEVIYAGHGTWKCYAFVADIVESRTHVIGLPHLSYYNIINKPEIVDWIKNKLST